MTSCPNPHLKQVLLGQVAQSLDFQNSTGCQGWKLYSLSGPLFPCLTILRVKKCFIVLLVVAHCQSARTLHILCLRERSLGEDLKIREAASWGSKEMWCHTDAVNLLVGGKKLTICFTEVLLGRCFSTYSSWSDLESMAAWLGCWQTDASENYPFSWLA